MPRSPITALLAIFCAMLSACSIAPVEDNARITLPAITAFSNAKPGDELPGGWRAWSFSRLKKPTEYRMVSLRGRNVMRAHAHGSASGLTHDVDVDLKSFPVLRWRWLVEELIPGADNTQAHAEDSPVRIVLAFSGDKSKWDFGERILATQLRMLAGFEMPYATLTYIWENNAPKGTLIHSRHTGRSKMIVAESGKEKLGQWWEESRNVYEDYKRAFGEEPGRLYAIAIMTDTDNTGATSHAYYGDIVFEKSPTSGDVNSGNGK
ncbi:MAG: DUF3047 domain-containing protein [Burkholderiales bacterium]